MPQATPPNDWPPSLSEQDVRRLSRIYRTLSDTSAAIVQSTDEDALVQRICDITLQLDDISLVWVGIHDTEHQFLLPKAAVGTRKAQLLAAKLPLDPSLPESSSLACEALRTGSLLVRNDYHSDSERAYWHKQPVAQEVLSALCLPLRCHQQIIGVLSIGAQRRDYFDAEIVRLFDQMGQNLSFAIENLRRSNELHLTMRALAESEERLRLALIAANQGLYDLDVQTGAATVSPEYAKILGYDPATFVETNAQWVARLHPADRAATTSKFRAFIEGEIPFYAAEFRQQTATGDWKWILSLGKIVAWDTDGKPLRMIGTHTDITARKQAEETLRERETKYRTLFDNMTQGVFYQRADGVLEDINEAALDIFGLTRADLVTRTSQSPEWRVYNEAGAALPGDQHPSMAALLSGKPIRQVVGVFNPQKQAIVWLDISAIPQFRANEAHPFQVFVTVHDITERKQTEKRLRKAMEDLKRSNTELEQFAYVASHDLQEPLRGVAGMVQLLQQRYQGQLDAKADLYITHAVEGATRMQALINDLLTFSRVDTRAKAFEPVSAEAALNTALINLGLTIREHHATITHDPLPTVIADTSQLTQLFQNLLSNAIKFHGDAAPVIHIGIDQLANEWRFWVRDNGIGIEPAYFTRIFEVFQRLHTRKLYPGTGIGLAICKKIVERHGGRIFVESEPASGSTFFFTIPQRRSHDIGSVAI